jgi:hypothetical protein
MRGPLARNLPAAFLLTFVDVRLDIPRTSCPHVMRLKEGNHETSSEMLFTDSDFIKLSGALRLAAASINGERIVFTGSRK